MLLPLTWHPQLQQRAMLQSLHTPDTTPQQRHLTAQVLLHLLLQELWLQKFVSWKLSLCGSYRCRPWCLDQLRCAQQLQVLLQLLLLRFRSCCKGLTNAVEHRPHRLHHKICRHCSSANQTAAGCRQ
jgi:hypothetical protein